ncbi:MAG: hypothetical protein IPH08_04075 [Rhodocyclaceae bacterium]|nr:hypothetical protein [Rhodocyclaceae bacterium]
MRKLVCPDCKSTNVTPGIGHLLHKCDSCHLAFETWDEDEYAEEQWESMTNKERDNWIGRVEASLDLRDLFINADNGEMQVLNELVERIARDRFREEVSG